MTDINDLHKRLQAAEQFLAKARAYENWAKRAEVTVRAAITPAMDAFEIEAETDASDPARWVVGRMAAEVGKALEALEEQRAEYEYSVFCAEDDLERSQAALRAAESAA